MFSQKIKKQMHVSIYAQKSMFLSTVDWILFYNFRECKNLILRIIIWWNWKIKKKTMLHLRLKILFPWGDPDISILIQTWDISQIWLVIQWNKNVIFYRWIKKYLSKIFLEICCLKSEMPIYGILEVFDLWFSSKAMV